MKRRKEKKEEFRDLYFPNKKEKNFKTMTQEDQELNKKAESLSITLNDVEKYFNTIYGENSEIGQDSLMRFLHRSYNRAQLEALEQAMTELLINNWDYFYPLVKNSEGRGIIYQFVTNFFPRALSQREYKTYTQRIKQGIYEPVREIWREEEAVVVPPPVIIDIGNVEELPRLEVDRIFAGFLFDDEFFRGREMQLNIQGQVVRTRAWVKDNELNLIPLGRRSELVLNEGYKNTIHEWEEDNQLFLAPIQGDHQPWNVADVKNEILRHIGLANQGDGEVIPGPIYQNAFDAMRNLQQRGPIGLRVNISEWMEIYANDVWSHARPLCEYIFGHRPLSQFLEEGDEMEREFEKQGCITMTNRVLRDLLLNYCQEMQVNLNLYRIYSCIFGVGFSWNDWVVSQERQQKKMAQYKIGTPGPDRVMGRAYESFETTNFRRNLTTDQQFGIPRNAPQNYRFNSGLADDWARNWADPITLTDNHDLKDIEEFTRRRLLQNLSTIQVINIRNQTFKFVSDCTLILFLLTKSSTLGDVLFDNEWMDVNSGEQNSWFGNKILITNILMFSNFLAKIVRESERMQNRAFLNQFIVTKNSSEASIRHFIGRGLQQERRAQGRKVLTTLDLSGRVHANGWDSQYLVEALRTILLATIEAQYEAKRTWDDWSELLTPLQKWIALRNDGYRFLCTIQLKIVTTGTIALGPDTMQNQNIEPLLQNQQRLEDGKNTTNTMFRYRRLKITPEQYQSILDDADGDSEAFSRNVAIQLLRYLESVVKYNYTSGDVPDQEEEEEEDTTDYLVQNRNMQTQRVLNIRASEGDRQDLLNAQRAINIRNRHMCDYFTSPAKEDDFLDWVFANRSPLYTPVMGARQIFIRTLTNDQKTEPFSAWTFQDRKQYSAELVGEYLEEKAQKDFEVAVLGCIREMQIFTVKESALVNNEDLNWVFDREKLQDVPRYEISVDEYYEEKYEELKYDCKFKVFVYCTEFFTKSEHAEEVENLFEKPEIVFYSNKIQERGLIWCLKHFAEKQKCENGLDICFYDYKGKPTAERKNIGPLKRLRQETIMVMDNGFHRYIARKAILRNPWFGYSRPVVIKPYELPLKKISKPKYEVPKDCLYISYDLETTSLDAQDKEAVQCYMQPFIVTFVYVDGQEAQYSENGLPNNFQEKIFSAGLGRGETLISEAFQWLREFLEKASRVYKKVYFMGFNSNSFDFQFFRKFFIQTWPQIEFQGRISDFVSATILGNVSIIDVKKIVGTGSLNSWCKSMGLSQKLNHGKWLNSMLQWFQLPQEEKKKWIEYCVEDSRLCLQLYFSLISKLCKLVAEMKGEGNVSGLTFKSLSKNSAASVAFKIYSKYFASEQIQPNASPVIQNIYRESYGGGLTINFSREKVICNENETISYLDINSMYPFIMSSSLFPLEQGKIFDPKPQYRKVTKDNWRQMISEQNQYFLFEINTFKYKENVKISSFGVRIKGTVQYVRELKSEDQKTVTVWGFQLITAFQSGGLEEINIQRIVKHTTLGRPFKQFVELFYAKRLQAKQDKQEDYQSLIKLILNSTYGKLGQRIFEVVRYFLFEQDEQLERYINNLKESDILALYKHQKAGITEVVSQEDSDWRNGTGAFTYIASLITARGRDMIAKKILLLENIAGCQVLYCDTDSIVVKHPKNFQLNTVMDLDDKILGHFKVEHAEISYFYGFAPKFYAFLNKQKKFVYKTKGFKINVPQELTDEKDISDYKQQIYSQIFKNIDDKIYQIEQINWKRNLQTERVQQIKYNKTLTLNSQNKRRYENNTSYLLNQL